MTIPLKNNPKVSIVIPLKEINQNLKECIDSCLKLDYPNFDIIVLPDKNSKDFKSSSEKIKVIETGNLTPPKKRDFALDKTDADILAFIDDDAYPVKDWLNNALVHFKDGEVAAVCGPAVTPASDSLRQKASGEVYESFLVSGMHALRYKSQKITLVKDYPSCNFLIRRSIFADLGGFNTNFWPGEDTFLCAAITRKLNKKIIYDPGVLVYHHRRPLYIPHLKQVVSYALHRGYFVKRGLNPTFEITYFFPSFLLVGLIFGFVLALFSHQLKIAYLALVAVYLLLVLIFSISKDLRLIRSTAPKALSSGDGNRRRSVSTLSKPQPLGWGASNGLILLKFLGIIMTHIAYGFFFLKGLFQTKLKEE
ncbi:MAG: glycosyltransferase [Candidatus Omnitrophica bacterium]|nr:glycosyltransferase [Candidatus Omnitrophota bacterium]